MRSGCCRRTTLATCRCILNFIRNFASGVPLAGESILTGSPLTYPSGRRTCSTACWKFTRGGYHPWRWSGWDWSARPDTAICLWRWGGAFGVAAFLFNGGLAGFVVSANMGDFGFQQDLTWKNLSLDVRHATRVADRSAGGATRAVTRREKWFRGGRRSSPLAAVRTLCRRCRFFNVHAFIFLSLILLAMFIAGKEGAPGVVWVLSWRRVIPATVGVVLVTGAFSADSGAGWAHLGLGREKWWGALCDVGNFLGDTSAAVVLELRHRLGADDRAGHRPHASRRTRRRAALLWTSMLIFGLCCLSSLPHGRGTT